MPAPVRNKVDNYDGTITVTKRCVFCQKPSVLTVPTDAYLLWNEGSGPMIQECLPSLTADERETLISGTHASCFDDAFGSDEE